MYGGLATSPLPALLERCYEQNAKQVSATMTPLANAPVRCDIRAQVTETGFNTVIEMGKCKPRNPVITGVLGLVLP